VFPTNNSCTAAIICMGLATFSSLAKAESGDYLSRRDTISLSAGDASRTNIAIQTPTPWPSYVNDTAIPGYGPRAVNVIKNLNKQPAEEQAAPASEADVNAPPAQ
jgi:hypothetical protein